MGAFCLLVNEIAVVVANVQISTNRTTQTVLLYRFQQGRGLMLLSSDSLCLSMIDASYTRSSTAMASTS